MQHYLPDRFYRQFPRSTSVKAQVPEQNVRRATLKCVSGEQTEERRGERELFPSIYSPCSPYVLLGQDMLLLQPDQTILTDWLTVSWVKASFGWLHFRGNSCLAPSLWRAPSLGVRDSLYAKDQIPRSSSTSPRPSCLNIVSSASEANYYSVAELFTHCETQRGAHWNYGNKTTATTGVSLLLVGQRGPRVRPLVK